MALSVGWFEWEKKKSRKWNAYENITDKKKVFLVELVHAFSGICLRCGCHHRWFQFWWRHRLCVKCDLIKYLRWMKWQIQFCFLLCEPVFNSLNAFKIEFQVWIGPIWNHYMHTVILSIIMRIYSNYAGWYDKYPCELDIIYSITSGVFFLFFRFFPFFCIFLIFLYFLFHFPEVSCEFHPFRSHQ